MVTYNYVNTVTGSNTNQPKTQRSTSHTESTLLSSDNWLFTNPLRASKPAKRFGERTTRNPILAWSELKQNSSDKMISLTKCETVHLAQ